MKVAHKARDIFASQKLLIGDSLAFLSVEILNKNVDVWGFKMF